MTILDQTTDKYLRNSCILAGLLHIIHFNFGIKIYTTMLMKLAIAAEKILLWFPSLGGYFEPLYKWFIGKINKKTGLNFIMRKQFVESFDGDTLSYGFGTKNYSQIYKDAEKRGVLTMLDIEKMKTYTGRTAYHHMVYDYSKKGHIINSMGMLPYECSLEVLKELRSQNFIYSPMRTIIANDDFTKLVVSITRQMYRYDRKGKLEEYLEKATKTEAFNKARDLYDYKK